MEDERAEKRRRVLAILDALELEAVVLRDPANIAWYGGGARARIVEGGDLGVFDIVVRRDGDEIATDEIEAPRLADEELTGFAGTFRVARWDEGREGLLPRGPRIGTDVPYEGAADVRDALVRARQRLTPPEIERYARLGADAAAAMTDAILALTPAMSEWTAAGELAARLMQRGIVPVVLLAAGESRLGRYRHPLPTAAPLGGRGMLVVCGRRDGLIANLTRLFAFGPIEPEGAERYERLLRVEAAFLDALRPGRSVGDVFRAGAAAYAANGFDRDEWRRHHQGGPCGYAPRDAIATAAAEGPVDLAQAFAWNPSAAGIKVEDTVVTTSHGPALLTGDPRWPVIRVAGRDRPAILER